MVVKVTSVDAVLFVEAIIQPDIVFAIVQRVGLLKRRIIRGGGVRVSRRQFLHRAVNCGDSFAVRGQQAAWDYVSGKTASPDRRRLNTAVSIENRSDAGISRLRRIPQRSVIRRAYDPVWSAQAEGEIAPSFGPGWQRASHRRRVQPYVFPLLPGKKEKLVFLDGPIKVPAEIIKAKFSPYRRKEGARIQLIVTEKFEDAAVITIAAAPGDDVNRCAGVAPVLG